MPHINEYRIDHKTTPEVHRRTGTRPGDCFYFEELRDGAEGRYRWDGRAVGGCRLIERAGRQLLEWLLDEGEDANTAVTCEPYDAQFVDGGSTLSLKCNDVWLHFVLVER